MSTSQGSDPGLAKAVVVALLVAMAVCLLTLLLMGGITQVLQVENQ